MLNTNADRIVEFYVNVNRDRPGRGLNGRSIITEGPSRSHRSVGSRSTSPSETRRSAGPAIMSSQASAVPPTPRNPMIIRMSESCCTPVPETRLGSSAVTPRDPLGTPSASTAAPNMRLWNSPAPSKNN